MGVSLGSGVSRGAGLTLGVTGVGAAGVAALSSGGGGGAADPDWDSVVSLLHFDGADESTTFTDEKGFAWTSFADVQIDTDQSKFGGASMLLDGASDRLKADNDFGIGTGDYTIEMWARRQNTTTSRALFSLTGGLALYTSSGTGVSWYGGGSVLSGSFPNDGAFHHIAVARESGTVRLFIGGVQVGSGTENTNHTYTITTSVGPTIGAYPNGQQGFTGHIDDFRATVGVARYTADFTPPTEAFPDS